MAVVTTLVGAALVGEAVHLVARGGADDPARHRGSGERRGAREDRVAVNQQHRRQRHLRALVALQQLERHLLAFGHLFLLTARGDHCVHSLADAIDRSGTPQPRAEGDGGSVEQGVIDGHSAAFAVGATLRELREQTLTDALSGHLDQTKF